MVHGSMTHWVMISEAKLLKLWQPGKVFLSKSEFLINEDVNDSLERLHFDCTFKNERRVVNVGSFALTSNDQAAGNFLSSLHSPSRFH